MSAVLPEREPLRTLLHADRVKMVYRLVSLNLATAPFMALLVWWAASRTSPDATVAVWFALLLVVTFGRALLTRFYRRAAPQPAAAGRWGRRFTIGAFAAGLLWGTAGMLLFARDDNLSHITVAFLLPGIAATAIATLGPLKGAYHAFVLPLVLPLVVFLFFTGETVYIAIALAACALTAVLMAAAARYSRTVEESLQLRVENLALLDNLSQSNERLQQFNTRLQRETSEGRHAQSRAREQSRRLAMYVEQTPLAVIDTDLSYHVIAWNHGAENMFGYKPAEILGKSLLEAIVPRDNHRLVQDFVDQLKRGKHPGIELLQLVTRNGRMMVGEWHVSTIRDNSGEITGLAAAVQDVTERSHLDRMKNEFITSVSKELHRPLIAMGQAIGTLMNGPRAALTSQAANLIRTVQGHCLQLTSLTETLLEVERLDCEPGGLALKPLSLVSVARRAVADCQGLAESRDIGLDFIEPPPEAIIEGDEAPLLKVFTSLILTAIKSSHEGGCVQVSLAVDEKHGYLSISNRAAAAANDFQAQVMQKLSSPEGPLSHSGGDISLGLFVSRRIIEKQGGKLSLESYHNVGNTFHIELPRSAPAA
ncbi:MAG: PAS domain S-box protein [Burkholderiales bacterium]|nr:PAS domain S-box protein [Burkholderiales bacterium]